VLEASKQLGGKETQRFINAMGEIDESYSSNRVQ
jgi:hypothetical protein